MFFVFPLQQHINTSRSIKFFHEKIEKWLRENLLTLKNNKSIKRLNISAR